MLLLIVPAAGILAAAFQAVEHHHRRRRSAIARPVPLFLAALISMAFPMMYWYLWGIRHVTVTHDDLAAIEWIAENTPEEALIGTNYGDAGVWIPALIGRAVTNPHWHILHKDEVEAWQKELEPDFVFVGAKRMYSGNPFSRDELLDDPGYEERFRSDGASVFEVR
jgi:hypothetical protein